MFAADAAGQEARGVETDSRLWEALYYDATESTRVARVDLPRLAAAREEVRGGTSAMLPLTLFDGVTFDAVFERAEKTGSGYALSGRLDGRPLSSVTIVVNGDAVAGLVNSVEGTWLIRSRGAGVVEIRKSEETFRCVVGDPGRGSSVGGRAARSTLPSAGGVSADLNDGDEIDVLVLFTAAARRKENGLDGMRASIDLMVASTNEAYRAGGAAQRVRLAAAVEVDYQESSEDNGNSIDLGFLAGTTDGRMDEIHDLRNSYAADLVYLVIDHPQWVTGGVAWGVPGTDGDYSDVAFAVGEVDDGPVVFAHELGHLMGLQHDRFTIIHGDGGHGLNQPFPYAHGYVNQRAFDDGAVWQSRWRTIMSYAFQCAAAGFNEDGKNCVQLMRFSNPAQLFRGDPMGRSGDAPSDAVDGPADAVRTLNNTRSMIANYRRRADACRLALSEAGRTLDAGGASIAVRVEGAERCSWQAWSTDDFLSLSRRAGRGGDELEVRVAPNTGRARIGHVIVAGETLTVRQSGAVPISDVCGRTPVVAERLAALANRANCGDVTEFDLLNVGVLDLAERGITALTAGDFDGLWNLSRLDLRNNAIRGLPEGVFDDLVGLNTLFLSDNELSRLPAGTFDALSGLRVLRLGNNSLTRIPQGAFDRLTKLQDLELGGNGLTALPDNLFANLAELRGLRLGYNQFTEIPGALRTGLVSLFFLDFSFNFLQTLPAHAFSGLPKLDQLFLWGDRNNPGRQLSSIARDAFSGLTTLSHLHLDRNDIADLSGVVIPGGDISLLGLSGNALSSLPAGLFRGFTSEACSGGTISLVMNLTDNPGSPFSLAVELVRVDGPNSAALPARVVARVREGAPWPLGVELAVEGGSSSVTRVVIPNGGVESEPFEVTGPAGQPVTVRVRRASELPATYRGIEIVAGAPLWLVGQANRRPERVGVLPPVALGDEAETVEVSGAFRDPDGDVLTYGARSSSPGVALVAVSGSGVLVTPVSEGTAVVTVTATDPGGLSATQSFGVTVRTASAPFTDDPVVPGVTPVRAVHFTEIRTRIDARRTAAGLAPFRWTDPVLRSGVTRVRLVHLLEMRGALAGAYAAAGRPAPRWTDAAPTGGATPIRAAHVAELRAAVVALE